MIKAVVGSPAGPAMAGLVFGNDIKLTLSIKSINFRIYSVHLSNSRLIRIFSFCSFVVFEINSVRLEYILSLSSFGCWIDVFLINW